MNNYFASQLLWGSLSKVSYKCHTLHVFLWKYRYLSTKVHRTRQRSTTRWNYLSWTYIGCIWRLHSIGSLMWLAVNKWLGHFSPWCTLTFLFMKQKMRVLLLQRLGLYCSDLHFRVPACCLYGDAHRHTAHSQTNPHMLCVAAAPFAGRRQEFTKTHTHTHIPCNKGPTVWWKDELLHCIIRMTHQTLINENRMKFLIKGEKCRHEEMNIPYQQSNIDKTLITIHITVHGRVCFMQVWFPFKSK